MTVYLLLMAAAFAAGAINSVAGGGSFLTFPSLVFAGVPAVIANASNTVALVPGSMASVMGYREDIRRLADKRLKSWFITCLLGGAVGAALLLFTSDTTFRRIAPLATASCHITVRIRQPSQLGAARALTFEPGADARVAIPDSRVWGLFRRRDRDYDSGGISPLWIE